MSKEKVTLMGYRCTRCGHEWLPRKGANGEEPTEPPRICPKCKSPYWDVPRKKSTAKKGTHSG